ncbi:MAG: glycosyltransferase family 9 protein [Deltaproteobacteria bacterium]|nr:glycosyltransferase family 9 protein [Deltaproteobacteria bacterium]
MATLPAHPSRTVVVQTAFLGDVVFTAPLVRALKRRFPATQLTLVVAPRGEAIAKHLPGVDSVVVLDKRGAHRSLAATWRFGKSLQADLVVVPHPSTRSALLAAAIPGAFKVGPSSFPQRLAFDLPVAMNAPEFVQRMLGMARAIGAESTPDLHLRLSDDELQRGRELLGSGRFAAAVVGSEWATKRLPPETWAEVLDGLVERGLTPVLLGAPREKALSDAVLAASSKRGAYRDFVGNSIEESLSLLAASTVVLGGDTGLLHAARALGVPAIVFFGPTDPQAHVWEPASEVVSQKLACQPCHAHGPPVCPLGHHDCLAKLPAEKLLAAVQGRLR